MRKKRISRIRFRISIISANAVIVVFLTAVIIAIVLTSSLRSTRESADMLFKEVGNRATEKIGTQMDSLLGFASLGSVIPGTEVQITGSGGSHPALPFMRQCLISQPGLYSIYYGRNDGTFLQLISAGRNPRILEPHEAPEETEYILRSIEKQKDRRVQHWTFLDSSWQSLGMRAEPDPDYDPRKRTWYINSEKSDDSLLSEPYIFHSLQQLGITGHRRLPSGSGVIGVDMTLADLNIFVEEETPSENGGILLLDQENRLLAGTKTLEVRFNTAFTLLEPLPSAMKEKLSKSNSPGTREYLIYRTAWSGGDENSINIQIVSPLSDFTRHLTKMNWRIIIFSLLLLVVVLALAFVIFQKLTAILTSLATDAERVRHLDFSGSIARGSVFLEFHQLAEGFLQMKRTIANRTEALDATLKKLEKIVDLGIAMAVERDVNHLSEMILQGAKTLSNADGGSLYLQDGDDSLGFRIVLNDTMGFIQGGTSGNPITLPPVRLYNNDGTPNHNNVVTHAFHTGETSNIADAYTTRRFDFSGTREFDERNGYESHSFLTVPLRPRGGNVIGAIQLINAKDKRTGKIVSFSEEIQRFVEALTAAAATSLYNRDLLETQQKLFDSMIHFTAGAIDAKSHYTGAHCERVPKIALTLAEAASNTETGLLQDFKIKTQEEWHTFQVAAWLHDCGKVTTPEYVVDKATKLETIHNRIHEIRTRFEVLLRDAEIQKYRSILDGTDPENAELEYESRKTELNKNFTFIAECNSGDKFMEPEDMESIKRIGAQTWVRHFNDTIGLSWEEQHRTGNKKGGLLGCVETLLADKPEHLIPRSPESWEEYAKHGFTLSVPEHLYNRGEIYNLCIQRGTLTAEERFKINEHVIQTIVMLENLPLPESMKLVPNYAGTHHETMKGSGYPRGLDYKDLSIPARIMAIADIFEALTASDRPYKKTKSLSKSIQILHSFKKEGDIDPVLFDLFLSSGVYKEYAEKYLQPEQLDEVDIEQYVG